MRSCYSADEFHMAFPRKTQQAFLEGHAAAFGYFNGVFRQIRYDNLASAVKKILSGRRREESDRFVALRSHYLFASFFCRPGKEGAHEKGGVEGGVGRFRRNHLVPVPSFRDFDELNRYLFSRCIADRSRTIPGKVKTVEEDRQDEVSLLSLLPQLAFPTAEVGGGRVDAKGLVNIKTNRYSVPIGLTGRNVEVRRHARTVEMVHGGRLVAAHDRIFERFGIQVTLDHYLDLLRLKPGAFKGSLPLSQAKAAGTFPPSTTVSGRSSSSATGRRRGPSNWWRCSCFIDRLPGPRWRRRSRTLCGWAAATLEPLPFWYAIRLQRRRRPLHP